MARRTVLTSRQRSALFSLRQREADLLRHCTVSDEDLQHIGARRRSVNKLGFALQLCVLRYPGRLLTPGEFVPRAVVDFIGRQLDLEADELADYAVGSETGPRPATSILPTCAPDRGHRGPRRARLDVDCQPAAGDRLARGHRRPEPSRRYSEKEHCQ